MNERLGILHISDIHACAKNKATLKHLVDRIKTDIQTIQLQKNVSVKMKQIVSSIQKEQNEIIRKNDVDLLIVQGPAGSGKTSIAMHKIGYAAAGIAAGAATVAGIAALIHKLK